MVIECPCGTVINEPSEYRLLFLKKNLKEIDLLCPNPECYLKELGFVRFHIKESHKLALDLAKFHAPFVTWNATQIGQENAVNELKAHLSSLISNKIDWKWIACQMEEEMDANSHS